MTTAPASCSPTGRELRLVRGGAEIDLQAAQQAVVDLLRGMGQDPDDPHMADTPRRVASAYAEMLTPLAFNLTTFPNDEGYDELVLARGIPFHSLCQHHLLSFKGVAHVGYLPGDRILGATIPQLHLPLHHGRHAAAAVRTEHPLGQGDIPAAPCRAGRRMRPGDRASGEAVAPTLIP